MRKFVILGEISHIETIATGRSIREISRLRKIYGAGRWRKLKGIALIEFPEGAVFKAEIHWYEAHGVGRKEVKIKALLDERR